MSRPQRLALLIAGGLGVLAIALPLTVFGVVPLFVRSTLHEAPPAAAAASPQAVAEPGPALTPVPVRPLLRGQLRRVDAVHFGNGSVSISEAEGGPVLRFEQVEIAGAPNMYVYLSDRADGAPGHFSDLGPLKATNGSFNYALPAGVDLAGIRAVVVWCRAFNVTVTYAPLA